MRTQIFGGEYYPEIIENYPWQPKMHEYGMPQQPNYQPHPMQPISNPGYIEEPQQGVHEQPQPDAEQEQPQPQYGGEQRHPTPVQYDNEQEQPQPQEPPQEAPEPDQEERGQEEREPEREQPQTQPQPQANYGSGYEEHDSDRSEYAKYADIYKYSWKDSDNANAMHSSNQRPPFQPPPPTFKSLDVERDVNEETGPIPVPNGYPAESVQRENYITPYNPTSHMDSSASTMSETRVNASAAFDEEPESIIAISRANISESAPAVETTTSPAAAVTSANSRATPSSIRRFFERNRHNGASRPETPATLGGQENNANPLRNLFRVTRLEQNRQKQSDNGTQSDSSPSRKPVVIKFSG